MPIAVQLRYALDGAVRILGWNHTNGSALTVAPYVRDLTDLAGTQVGIPSGGPFTTSCCNGCCGPMGSAGRTAQRSRADSTVELIVMSRLDMVPAPGDRLDRRLFVADPFML